MTYLFLFGSFWIWRCFSAVYIITDAMIMEHFYREKLGLYLHDLQTLRWHEVVSRLIKLHSHGIHRVAIKEVLTEHDVVLRIMRKDNYMIGMINTKVLDLRVPWWVSPFMNNDHLFLTKSLEWSLSFCILEYVFNEQFNISTLFLRDKVGLQRRFIVVGVIHFLLLPFMLVFMVIHFVLSNAQQFHSSKAYLGPRQWSPLALWTFREFNELPHVFEDRINNSYGPTNDYLSLFYNPYVSIVARCISYMAGSFIAVLLFLSLLGEGILLYVHIGGHNLLWYVGVLSAIFAGARSIVPDESSKYSNLHKKGNHEELVTQIASYTHYYPQYWFQRCHTIIVKEDISYLFPYKINLFLMEILSVLLTPMVLCFSLPTCASTIIDFVRDHSRYIEGVGTVCDYSLFELDKYGDENYGTLLNENNRNEKNKLLNGKLEQSFINFKTTHPRWNNTYDQTNTGNIMFDRIHLYKFGKEHQRETYLANTLQQSMTMTNIKNVMDQTSKNPNTPYTTNYTDKTSALNNNINKSYKGTLIDNKNGAGLTQGIWTSKGYERSPEITSMNAKTTNIENKEDLIADINKSENDEEIESKPLLPPVLHDTTRRRVEESFFDNQPVSPISGGKIQDSLRFSQSTDANDNNAGINAFGASNLPSVLRSIMREENIDFENDFYWLQRFRQERYHEGSEFMEKSLNKSSLYMSNNFST